MKKPEECACACCKKRNKGVGVVAVGELPEQHIYCLIKPTTGLRQQRATQTCNHTSMTLRICAFNYSFSSVGLLRLNLY